jgi:exonuclease VII small subunit
MNCTCARIASCKHRLTSAERQTQDLFSEDGQDDEDNVSRAEEPGRCRVAS